MNIYKDRLSNKCIDEDQKQMSKLLIYIMNWFQWAGFRKCSYKIDVLNM